MLRHIRDLKIGESGYTVPWALVYISQLTLDTLYEQLTLDTSYHVYDTKQGTVCMRVTRTGEYEQDFDVDISDVDSRYIDYR